MDVEALPEPMLFSGWGEPGARAELSRGAARFLRDRLDLGDELLPSVGLAEVRVSPSRLGEAAREALVAAVGREWVRDDHATRVVHAGGKSYPDLVRRRAGDAADAPDAVVLPATHAEVAEVLRVCDAQRVAVVPFGGGTSVVGGVEPLREGFDALVTLDLARLRRVVAVDATSLTATLEPGLRGPDAERALGEHGLTLGHFPQSFEYATVGGWVATRSAGQASTGYGRADELVVALRAATPVGDLRLGVAPASAAGPDLRALVVGSEGTLGVLTEVTLRVHRAPEQRVYEGWAFPSFTDGTEALRALIQADVAPHVTRVSDTDETSVALTQGSAVARGYLRARGLRAGGCLAILGWEGSRAEVARRRDATLRVLRRHPGTTLGARPGAVWAAGRYHGPYQRDALLDRGVMVETLETATSWSNLATLYAAVRAALHASLAARGTPPVVLCHVSHLYATGASLYFTWLARQERGAEIEQWRAAKTAASDAIRRHGGTITHHHAVGVDHRPWLAGEIGDLGVAVLRAVKDRLDPRGILNPGKLVPDAD